MTDEQDYNTIRQHAGVYPWGTHVASVSGEGHNELLTHAFARSVEYSQPGTVLETLVLDDDGQAVDLALVIIEDERALVISSAPTGLVERLREVVEERGADDVLIEPLESWSAAAVEGPEAWKVVAPLADGDIASLALNEWVETTVEGITGDARLARTGRTGEYGYVLLGEAPQDRLVDFLVSAAQEFGGHRISEPALLRASLEVNHPVFPELFEGDVTIPEVGMLWMAGAGREDDYVGSDALGELEARSRGLVAFIVQDGQAPEAGTSVCAEDKEVGKVHLSTVPVGAEGFGVAMLEVPLCVPGLELSAGNVSITTVSRPHAQLRSWSERIG